MGPIVVWSMCSFGSRPGRDSRNCSFTQNKKPVTSLNFEELPNFCLDIRTTENVSSKSSWKMINQPSELWVILPLQHHQLVLSPKEREYPEIHRSSQLGNTLERLFASLRVAQTLWMRIWTSHWSSGKLIAQWLEFLRLLCRKAGRSRGIGASFLRRRGSLLEKRRYWKGLPRRNSKSKGGISGAYNGGIEGKSLKILDGEAFNRFFDRNRKVVSNHGSFLFRLSCPRIHQGLKIEYLSQNSEENLL